MNTAAMDWQPSPSPGVLRKRLELIGSTEAGRVTSIVQYAPGSVFPAHDHPDGEEILVLEGVFSDEFGDYPAGSYLLNPTGFRHAPFSKPGCTIFVKLRQFSGATRQQVALNIQNLPWTPDSIPGIERKCLYTQPDYPEQVWLERWQPGTTQAHHTHPGGEEIFVLEGRLADENGEYSAGTWIRNPSGSDHTPFSKQGCVLYVRSGWRVPDPVVASEMLV